MKTYTFYVTTQNLTMSITAEHKFDARQTVVRQLHIKPSQADKIVVCMGINLQRVQS
jgi:hypothetical protein